MRRLLLCLLLAAISCESRTQDGVPPKSTEEKGQEAPATGPEQRVGQAVREVLHEKGRVTFSELHNSPDFGTEERAVLDRLYEVFFRIPAFLLSRHEAGKAPPSRQEIAQEFRISRESVDLLLQVIEVDPRMPRLFDRDLATHEISELDLAAIQAFVNRRGGFVKVADWEGQRLPDFSLQSLSSGESVTRADLKGSASLIYFWFSGCPPCVRIAPLLARLDKKFRSRGLKMIGFNADTLLNIPITAKKRAEYLAKAGVTYPNLQVTKEALTAFGNVNVYPTVFISDPNLTITAHFINYQELETLEKGIEDALPE